jgi:hypothetical protein
LGIVIHLGGLDPSMAGKPKALMHPELIRS